MAYKECFIPNCKNNTLNSPDKIFVRIREDLREKWCREAGVDYYKTYTQYCCEDHFDPREDLLNYLKHKLMGEEPKLKSSASLCNIRPTANTDSAEHPTTSKPIKSKYEDALNTPSTSSYSTSIMQVHVATQRAVKMVDISTYYKARKFDETENAVEVMPSSQETSSAATPSLFGCTSETEESTAYESKTEFQIRRIMLDIVTTKPLMYLGLPKQHFWLINYIVDKSTTKIDSLDIIVTLLKIKQNDTIERISDQFEISRTKLSSKVFTGIDKNRAISFKI